MFDILGSVAAAIASMALGFFWYSDALFGVAWRADMGFSDEMMAVEKNKGMAKQVILGFIAEFVTALVFSYFFYALGIINITQALTVAFWAWLGFSATLQFGEVLWARFSQKLFFINTTHRLLSFLLIATTLVLV
jgi:hypothetical protein